MKITIQPTEDVLQSWIKNYVPTVDLFFIYEDDLTLFQDYLQSVLVLPKKEFQQHSSYQNIQLVNSYEYWSIKDDYEYVIVAQPEWVTKLTNQKKKQLFARQYELQRGLIFPLASFPNKEEVPIHYLAGIESKVVVVQAYMWQELSTETRKEVLRLYAKEWESDSSQLAPDTIHPSLGKYVNTFPADSGSNCLSTVLFAVTKQEWILTEWVHQETLRCGLQMAGYEQIHTETFQEGDVITFLDDHGTIQHASYCFGNQLFFNKNGQTIFNPWKVVHLDELSKDWGRYKMVIYRVTEESFNAKNEAGHYESY
ncbi:hypothetical protein [Priestia koreensis]|uniref:hypothetical protein n=1 Tax=Priestia koreensis TaxID=284581 RepID=UPI001F589D4D|nr:hypothetical protein [Priestia koreensis]MCM3004109.1 hypothetical protein [Priestia koreensis]UNL83328.1 hypothetical protein IE339_14240 [Priestia koreensis]